MPLADTIHDRAAGSEDGTSTVDRRASRPRRMCEYLAMSAPTRDFVHMWEWFALHCHNYSPLYERLSIAVAGDPELLSWVQSAPPSAHLPPALLAAVHYLLLDDPDDPLAAIYSGRSAADPAPLFLQLCRDRQDEVMALLSTRHIQTNDCGRSALIGPGLTWLASQLSEPMALTDVGASAGLNLLCDRYRIDYGAAGATGPSDSPVQITCRVAGGNPPIAPALPPLRSRIGIDRSPIDLGRSGRCSLAVGLCMARHGPTRTHRRVHTPGPTGSPTGDRRGRQRRPPACSR